MNKGLTTINGADYKVSFSEKGYQDLNEQLRNDYSYIFLLVDTNTQKHCLPYFLEKIKTLEGKSVFEQPSRSPSAAGTGQQRCIGFRF